MTDSTYVKPHDDMLVDNLRVSNSLGFYDGNSGNEKEPIIEGLVGSIDPSAADNNKTLPTTAAVRDFVMANSAVPVGTVTMYAGEVGASLEETGWMVCDGRKLNAKDEPEYQVLLDVIGTTYGGNNDTNFRLPDCRGLFVRGVNADADDIYADSNVASRTSRYVGGQTGDGVGTYQGDELKSHSHPFVVYDVGTGPGSTLPKQANQKGEKPKTGETEVDGGTETRPKNIAMYYIIKFKHVSG